jgi:hypothetical protein
MSTRTSNDRSGTVIPVPDRQPAVPKKRRFFSRNKRQENVKDIEKDGTDDEGAEIKGPLSKHIAPVSFIELFRYVRFGWLSAVYVLMVVMQLRHSV